MFNFGLTTCTIFVRASTGGTRETTTTLPRRDAAAATGENKTTRRAFALWRSVGGGVIVSERARARARNTLCYHGCELVYVFDLISETNFSQVFFAQLIVVTLIYARIMNISIYVDHFVSKT